MCRIQPDWANLRLDRDQISRAERIAICPVYYPGVPILIFNRTYQVVCRKGGCMFQQFRCTIGFQKIGLGSYNICTRVIGAVGPEITEIGFSATYPRLSVYRYWYL